MLVGRGSERARLDALLDDARVGRSGALVLRGEPGIGKTALLEYAADRAEGFEVLRALGVQAESELPFAALHELLRPFLDRLDALPELHARALRAAFALGPVDDLEHFAIFVATLGLLTDAAAERPVLCLVDDAQWIDDSSADALLFMARRLSADQVAVVFAAREEERQLFEAPGLPELRLVGLHEQAAEALLDDRAPGLSGELRARVLAASTGNPLALLEMPAALRGLPQESLNEPLPIGPRLERAFLGRVGALPKMTQRALLVAAASDTTDGAILADALEQLAIGLDALEEAESAGLVEFSAGQIRFAHPLVRSAVYGAAGPAERRLAHESLGRSFFRAGAHERRAWHLAAAATGPDEEAAGALEQAAEAAHRLRGVGAAARALERAARLTPDPAMRARRQVAAAQAARLAGRASTAAALIAEALTGPIDERTWAEAQAVLADILYWQGESDRVIRLAEGVDRVARADPAQGAAMLISAALARGPGALEQALALTDRALELVPGMHDAAIAKANYLFRLGRGSEADALLTRIAGGPTISAPDKVELAVMLSALERYDEARTLSTEALVELREAAELKQLAHALAAYTQVETRRGDLHAGYESGLACLSLSNDLGEPLQLAFGASFLAACEAFMGNEEGVRRHAAIAIEAVPGELMRTTLEARAALGLLELQLGHADRAIAELEPVVDALRAMGVREPGYVQAAPELVEAHIRAGRRTEAKTVLEELEEQAQATHRIWALAAAARCRGLLESDDELDGHFQEALSWHAQTARPVEQARTELAFGERLRRAGRRLEAREPLRAAVATFDRTGARLLAERARRELAASGERIRRKTTSREELSPQEMQVALVVARGATNKEAAAELFLSPKTIEFHLRNAYRKLGVTSRTQLANALRAPQPR